MIFKFYFSNNLDYFYPLMALDFTDPIFLPALYQDQRLRAQIDQATLYIVKM